MSKMLSEEELGLAWALMTQEGINPIDARARIKAHIAAQAEQLAARPPLWECPDCGFAFDAGHKDEPDGGHSCPCCAERRLTEQLEKAESETERIRGLWKSLMRAAGEPECHLRALEAIGRMKAERDALAKLVEKYRRDLLGQQDEVDDVKAELTRRAERIAVLEKIAKIAQELDGGGGLPRVPGRVTHLRISLREALAALDQKGAADA